MKTQKITIQELKKYIREQARKILNESLTYVGKGWTVKNNLTGQQGKVVNVVNDDYFIVKYDNGKTKTVSIDNGKVKDFSVVKRLPRQIDEISIDVQKQLQKYQDEFKKTNDKIDKYIDSGATITDADPLMIKARRLRGKINVLKQKQKNTF